MTHPPMANFWVHGGLLLFDNRKMAKSLGNFEPLSDLLARHDPQAIRWLFLQTGYRKVMNFTEDSIASAALGLARIKAAYRNLAPATDGESVASPELDERMEAALDDDMNTAAALAVLYDIVDRTTPSREDLAYWLGILGVAPNDSWLEEPRVELAPDFVARLQEALRAASSDTSSHSIDGASPEDAIERVVALRGEARRAKDWAASDRLRDALLSCGVEVKDSKDGTTWHVTA
jgi:cysteinyl-tRNA synthetase